MRLRDALNIHMKGMGDHPEPHLEHDRHVEPPRPVLVCVAVLFII